MKPLKSAVCVSLDADLLEVLRRSAEENDRSLSSYINLILKQHLEDTSSVTDKP